MRVSVLFFGATAAVTGKNRVELHTDGPKTRDVFNQILDEHPALGSRRLLFSLNQEYSTGDEVVHEGDELAVFTPVSGG